MNGQFYYEDGQGHVVDEHGCPEPMDYVVDEEMYTLQTISSHTDYLHTLHRVHNHEPIVVHVDKVQRQSKILQTDVREGFECISCCKAVGNSCSLGAKVGAAV
ncbi:hypothetical protein G6F60_014493 [Rhizopus arrhizus]|uniref:Uncharacterized protein n=1 Tax=Rhizopus oryzae TaxID=64495 RepID=A0A9P6X836_RHIOR|nr:hypothetical protein G6F23_014641 [Rhizopus arrhizus]KAG0741132.1 hypothetical protein G6F24_016804 [Rhizopus arrhizus]KAG0891186.1 hypothetical protein G6F33_014132 [Rhizopus arrhizus]KAG0920509.1 hypothetical protein G6F32_015566 [Rhizopus arrhizus]KAG0922846.1 hypothetical protein G6F31_019750 [Rhizopus arrhizus]